MTPQEWKEVETKLQSFYETVTLNCDGYKVELILKRVTPYKNAIVIFVNGKIKGEWITDDCEERRRFFRPVSKYLFPQKYRTSMKKEPKWLQKKFPNTNKKYTYYVPDWLSFNALKRHLVKNNSHIKLIWEEDTNEDRYQTKVLSSCSQNGIRP